MKKAKFLVTIWNKMEEYFLVYSLILMVILVFIQVIMRYIFNNSLSWSEELVRYIFIWQIWLGASVGAKNNDHIRIEIFSNKLKQKPREALEILINGMIFVFYIFLIWQGIMYLKTVISTSMTSTGLQIPLWIVYISLPVGSAAVAVRLAAFKCSGGTCDRNFRFTEFSYLYGLFAHGIY